MKVFYSVELEANSFMDDTFCGTYEECIAYLMEHDYKPEDDGYTNRIVKFQLEEEDRSNFDVHVMTETECDEYCDKFGDLDEFEAGEIIEDWSTDFAENLNQLRDRFGGVTPLTQRKLAELTGIPLRTVEDWSTGKRTPPLYMLELIACKLRYMGY